MNGFCLLGNRKGWSTSVFGVTTLCLQHSTSSLVQSFSMNYAKSQQWGCSKYLWEVSTVLLCLCILPLHLIPECLHDVKIRALWRTDHLLQNWLFFLLEIYIYIFFFNDCCCVFLVYVTGMIDENLSISLHKFLKRWLSSQFMLFFK